MSRLNLASRPLIMSRVNHAWQRFLKLRLKQVATDFTDFRCPSEPGLVSIVLPVYNGEDYVREAIASVLAQTYSHFELILVNDGSTDSTAEIIDKYRRRDSRVVVIHQENQKLPEALNRGFAVARGQFLTWTSADNNLKPDFLALLIADLQARPRVDMIYADYDVIDEHDRLLENSDWCRVLQDPPGSGHIRLLYDTSILNLVDGNYIGCAFLYRDRVAALIGPYDKSKFSWEDYDFFMRVNECLTLRHAAFEKALYEYRIHGESLSAREKDFGRARQTGESVLFDELRRDLFSYPLGWFIQTDLGPTAQRQAAALRRTIAQAGDLDLDFQSKAIQSFPRLWLPTVYAHFVSHLDRIPLPPALLPPSCLKALVYVGDEIGPMDVDASWDLCVALSPKAQPLRLPLVGQGWFACSSLATLRGALVIRALARQAQMIENAPESRFSSGPKASVVICTCDRSELLVRSIRSVCEQKPPHQDFELIIVNNQPAQDLSDVITPLQTEFFPSEPHRLRLVVCPIRGLSFARNAGLAEARGEVVAFLDDDALAREDWLAALVAAFDANPDLGVVGGPVLVQPPCPAPRWYHPSFLRFWSHFEPKATGLVRAADWMAFPYGANWSARRALLYRIGGFRAGYGRGGRRCDLGEEMVAALQIQRLGAAVGIEPAAVVDHCVQTSRFTLFNLWRSICDGWMLKFHLEQDLFLPGSLRAVDLVWHACKRLGRALFSPRLAPHQRLEHLFYGAAALRIAAAWLRMLIERFTKPQFWD